MYYEEPCSERGNRMEEGLLRLVLDGTQKPMPIPMPMPKPDGCSNAADMLRGRALAMVYAPEQPWQDLLDAETALQCGTLFAALNLPFYGGRARREGCGL
jgi:hypothetical protein